jgi:hypothetical protein
VVEADAAALADSMNAVGRPPGPKLLREYDEKIEAAHRKARATAILEVRAADAFEQAFGEHAPAWVEQLGEQHAALLSDKDALVAKLSVLVSQLAGVLALKAFASGRRYMPQKYASQVAAPSKSDYDTIATTFLLTSLNDLGRPTPEPVAEQVVAVTG